MRKLLFVFAVTLLTQISSAQDSLGTNYPVKGFAIGAPTPANLDSFIVFINNELVPRGVNTLVLRVDYGFQFKSHPELAAPNSLSVDDIHKLAAACKAKSIRIVPQINLLGHQSWASQNGMLLKVYPQFDETPWVKFPEKYVWPNADSLYCKSYCPVHPGVHKVVFDVVDELCDAFGATDFHAGMDEVFYIGMDKCPRCHGKNKAQLFAGEVKLIRDHLAAKHRQLWIWGDRLLDGATTGIGEWEASENGTYPAIDLIPKDVIVCDWHYERPDKTPVIFASKGLKVITCGWNRPAVGVEQVKDLVNFRRTATPEMQGRYYGLMETVWSDVSRFLHEYYHGASPRDDPEEKGAAETFRVMFPVSK